MRALAVLAIAILAGCVAPVPDDTIDRANLVPIAPFDTLGDAVRLTEGVQSTEMMLAMNPRDADHLVMTTKVADRTRAPVTVSFDGGATWKPAELPVDEFESDPVVAFAPDGGVVIVTLTTPPFAPATGGLLVGPDELIAYRSEDGGLTWTRGASMIPEGWINDHPWIATDFARGRIHVATASFDDENHPAQVVAGVYEVYSDDGGRTWSEPILVCEGCVAPVNAVGGDGAVYVGAPEGSRSLLFRSDDGGLTWTDEIVVEERASWTGSRGNCARQSRWTGLPSVAGGPGQRVHVAYVVRPEELLPVASPAGECPNFPNWDVVVRTSEDGGRTWLDPVVVNDDDGGRLSAQSVPAAATSPAGDLHVIWYDGRHDVTHFREMDVYYAHSRDGRTFDANIRVTPTPMPDNGVVNDYLGLVATNERAFLAYAVTEGSDAADVFLSTVS